MSLLAICQQILNLVKFIYLKQFNQVDLLVLSQAKKALKYVAILLGRDKIPRLVSNLASNAINTFERKW